MKTSRQIRERELYIDRVQKHPNWTERRIHNSVQKELNNKDNDNLDTELDKRELLVVKICAAALALVVLLHVIN